MSEAEKRALWRSWEATRDEDALRRYVWAVCREAPPTPPGVWWKTHPLGPASEAFAAGLEISQEDPWTFTGSRTVTAPVRRLTVCGPWLPPKIQTWFWRARQVAEAYRIVFPSNRAEPFVAADEIPAGSALYMGADGTLHAST